MTKRIQRQRTKGWRMPPDAVYVGRPSRWGNPYRVGSYYQYSGFMADEAAAVEAYRHLVGYSPPPNVDSLRGHDLACWCPLEDANGNRVPCHADVLLELARVSRG